MSKQVTYVFECDANQCAMASSPQENDYKLPDGWSQLNIAHSDYQKAKCLYFCPRCTGAIQDGFISLHEEEN